MWVNSNKEHGEKEKREPERALLFAICTKKVNSKKYSNISNSHIRIFRPTGFLTGGPLLIPIE